MELKDIQELMKVLKKEDIAELKVRYGKVKLTLTNSENTKIVNTAAALPKVTKEKKIAKAVLPAEEIVKSSNVGKIKLLSPKTGTLVKKGQILAKIKTMGIDNDVKATVNGTLKEVLVADGSAVDFAKELFKIEVN
ncbi:MULTISPECIES: acetyl-CoA carboxylase biotin carboxyl carrier protein [Leptotrichia]|jgi:putative acetyl-CoA carboxylase, biotin carboxyl carrier protein|uniref:Biotin/lipoyl attachment domain-containing protein n=1 Tax=Leptotrichia wadei TaxID=157687 RepID=A0A510KUM2_9FUSO|nr:MULTISPECIES: biotin/lipoyl-containing protein [Leptotrichia]NWO27617.1 acetyl-CoA carboxylase biotin carboxyl carrier protein subunit [Leptotrichia sp. oral taxon 417]BBM55324.1 biotin/lipoyl attachment domain-containing protein [Leptotrichia wadei]VTX74287.1 Biotin carboxyl carrier protein of acetyl-CoA carboxylase [uncultured Leptotrichia sp.]